MQPQRRRWHWPAAVGQGSEIGERLKLYIVPGIRNCESRNLTDVAERQGDRLGERRGAPQIEPQIDGDHHEAGGRACRRDVLMPRSLPRESAPPYVQPILGSWAAALALAARRRRHGGRGWRPTALARPDVCPPFAAGRTSLEEIQVIKEKWVQARVSNRLGAETRHRFRQPRNTAAQTSAGSAKTASTGRAQPKRPKPTARSHKSRDTIRASFARRKLRPKGRHRSSHRRERDEQSKAERGRRMGCERSFYRGSTRADRRPHGRHRGRPGHNSRARLGRVWMQ